jgi:hypothetical protein
MQNNENLIEYESKGNIFIIFLPFPLQRELEIKLFKYQIKN